MELFKTNAHFLLIILLIQDILMHALNNYLRTTIFFYAHDPAITDSFENKCLYMTVFTAS